MKKAVKDAKEMRKKDSDELILSYFIHGLGVDLQKTPLGIFRALLNALLPDFPTYLS